jgi:hypothetical protein
MGYVRRLLIPCLLSLAVMLGLPGPAHAERPGWYANPSLEGPAQVGATLVGNPGGIKCDNCLGTAYEWLSCTGPGPAGADRPTGGLPFDGHPAPGCVVRVPFPGSLTYVVRPDDAGRHIQLHIVAENHDCGEINYSAGTQECRNSQGHAYTNTVGPIAGGAAPAPAPAPTAPPAPAPAPAPSAPPPPPPATPPANSSLPVISGYAEEGETLTVSNGTWTGTEPLTFSYRWFRCSTALKGCQAIDGATGPSYTAAAADVGARLAATVTATNRGGGMPSTAARTDRVLPAQPQPGYRVVDAARLRSTHQLLITRIDGPRTVRARVTATLLVHVSDTRGFGVKGVGVELASATGTMTATTGASGVAVVRVRVGAPKAGRLVVMLRVSKPGEDALQATKRVVLRVLLV